jgi:2-oxoglutarate dehydrogenase E1 component
MGAWSHLLLHFNEARNFRVASRRFYSSPAAGSSTRSKNRHNEVIEYVFDESKNNFY